MIFDSTTYWVFFSLSGRISREIYWLGYMFLWSGFGFLINLHLQNPHLESITSPALFFFAICAIWGSVALTVKRAHDRGITGFVGFLVFVPMVQFLMFIYLGVAPGEDGPNMFGPRTNSQPTDHTKTD